MDALAIEDLLPQAKYSIYRLVRMAAKRALELSDGKPSLLAKPNSEKVTSIALEEVAHCRVVYKEVADTMAPPRTVKVEDNYTVPKAEDPDELKEEVVGAGSE